MTRRHAVPMAEYRHRRRIRLTATVAGYVLVLAVFLVDVVMVLAMPGASAH